MTITTSTEFIMYDHPELIDAMMRLLNTSLADIDSYDELTETEKLAISREEFDMLFL